jgi:predicted GNAT superfamily acetyltransferase
VVREFATPPEHDTVLALFEAVWGRSAEPPLSRELLTVIAFEGGYVTGAYAGAELVGASVGLFGLDPDGRLLLHSHITGVVPAGRGRHAGLVLKLHQRAWALERGITTIQWTFDPLVRRNAHFNVVKLAADPVCYLPDFYGDLGDTINAGHASDRLLVRWDLTSPDAVAAAAGIPRTADAPQSAVTLLDHPGDGPAHRSGFAAGWDAGPGGAPAPETGAVLVGTPADVEALRRSDPEAARAWRWAQREALGELLATGWRVTGFVDRRAYLLQR